jgi:hypothetical protein
MVVFLFFLVCPFIDIFSQLHLCPKSHFFKTKIKTHLPHKITNIFQFHPLLFFYLSNSVFIPFIVICFVWDHFLELFYNFILHGFFLSNLIYVRFIAIFFLLQVLKIDIYFYNFIIQK